MADPRGSQSPSRRPRISREFVEQFRRRRFVDASAELLHEFGREGATVTNIVRLAGTARNSFYDVFRSAEDCIAYGIGLGAGELFATLGAQDGGGEWLGEVRDAVAGFYGAVAAEPLLAELFLIHSATSRVDHGRAAARVGVERFSGLLARGRAEAQARGRRPLPTSTEEYFSRAIVSLAARRIWEGGVEELPAESRGVTALVGGFFLGPDAAERILAAPDAQSLGHETGQAVGTPGALRG
jgi:AcrR family transcriptional regulator